MISERIDMRQLDYVVSKHGLNGPSRKREKVYARFYMFHRLKPFLSFSGIGRIFSKDHATIIYGISQHNALKDYHDYKLIADQLESEFQHCIIKDDESRIEPIEDMNINEAVCLVVMDRLIAERYAEM